MERNEIIEKLAGILSLAMNKTPEEIGAYSEDSNLTTDLGLSSVGMLYIVIAIEEFFAIRFDDVSFGDFATVKDVIDYIEAKLN